jgi:hypothetical protein
MRRLDQAVSTVCRLCLEGTNRSKQTRAHPERSAAIAKTLTQPARSRDSSPRSEWRNEDIGNRATVSETAEKFGDRSTEVTIR